MRANLAAVVRFRSLTPKLIAAVLGGCLAVYGAILVVSARAAREMLVRGAQNEARAVASGASYQIAGVLRVAEGPPSGSRRSSSGSRGSSAERSRTCCGAMVGSGPSLSAPPPPSSRSPSIPGAGASHPTATGRGRRWR